MTAIPTSATTAILTDVLEVPGASLYHEVRGRSGPLIVLHAAPMDARSFEPLADLLAVDHTVLTADPRGIARSTVVDRLAPATPDQRAGDLARLIEHVGAAPAVVFGSSGGAVSALALAATSPGLLAGVIAHEPPLATLVDDTEELRRGTDEMIAIYRSGDRRGYWTKFLQVAAIDMPDDVFAMMFGDDPTGRDAEDERFGIEQMQLATTFWGVPLQTLQAVDVPIAVGIGADSTGQLCDRTSRALARALGLNSTMFPGDHVGFADQPQSFATVVRDTIRTLRADNAHPQSDR